MTEPPIPTSTSTPHIMAHWPTGLSEKKQALSLMAGHGGDVRVFGGVQSLSSAAPRNECSVAKNGGVNYSVDKAISITQPAGYRKRHTTTFYCCKVHWYALHTDTPKGLVWQGFCVDLAKSGSVKIYPAHWDFLEPIPRYPLSSFGLALGMALSPYLHRVNPAVPHPHFAPIPIDYSCMQTTFFSSLSTCQSRQAPPAKIK